MICLTSAAQEREASEAEKSQRSRLGDAVIHDVLNGGSVESFVPNGDVINVAIEEEVVSVILSGSDVEVFGFDRAVG